MCVCGEGGGGGGFNSNPEEAKKYGKTENSMSLVS